MTVATSVVGELSGRSLVRFGRPALHSAVAACLLLSGYHYLRYTLNQRWIERKAQDIVQTAGAVSRNDQIRALRDYLRRNVRWEGLPVEGRPFLRATARDVLESGQGYCGEATRAFVVMARSLGIAAMRVNLHGKVNHVTAEAELEPGRWVLVDVQENRDTNPYLDARWRTLDEAVASADSPFNDYSNINLRRLPIAHMFIQRIKLRSGVASWIVENPYLMKAVFFLTLCLFLVGLRATDLVLRRVYMYRLGFAPVRAN